MNIINKNKISLEREIWDIDQYNDYLFSKL